MSRTLNTLIAGAMLLSASALSFADVPRTPAPKDAKVYIISPADGATVDQTFTVQFGLQGMGVAPAGVDQANTGHHHLLVDVDKLPAMNMPLPATEQVIHFGGGQTQTQLTLKPGKHTLQLLMGDKNHVPHEPPVMSKKITVNVK